MTEQPSTPIPQMIYTDALDDSTLKLLSKVARNAAPIEIYDTAADEIMVHIVAADHDLQTLRQITDSEFATSLLNIAAWTGLTSLWQLLCARTKLTEGGVDVDLPDWGTLEDRAHSIAELIVLNKLGAHGAPMLASAYPAADWVTAIDDITEATGRDGWKDDAALVAALGAAEGLSPAVTTTRVRDAMAAGVSRYDLEHVFGSDALPFDLLAMHGASLAKGTFEMEQAGLDRGDYFALLRDGIPAEIISGIVGHGKITTPDEIRPLHHGGASPAFMARARAEALPVERWAQVMKPLAPYVSESKYGGWVSGIGSQTGLYRLQELSQDGVALPLRVAWDSPGGQLPEELSPEQRRRLAEHGVGPAEFLAVFQRLPQNHGYTLVKYRPVTDEDIEQIIAVVAAGGPDTFAVLERLLTGDIDRRTSGRKALRTMASELQQLVQLAPTEQEALYLGSVANSARGWIGQLQLWRRFEPETAEFTEMLHGMPEIEPFLVWLGQQKVTDLFYGKNPIRTEAVRMLTGKGPKGARPSYLHFVMLAEALERFGDGRGMRDRRYWTVEAVEGSKRLRHQIQRFMQAMSIVAREEHIGEQQELSVRVGIERGVKALPEKEA